MNLLGLWSFSLPNPHSFNEDITRPTNPSSFKNLLLEKKAISTETQKSVFYRFSL